MKKKNKVPVPVPVPVLASPYRTISLPKRIRENSPQKFRVFGRFKGTALHHRSKTRKVKEKKCIDESK